MEDAPEGSDLSPENLTNMTRCGKLDYKSEMMGVLSNTPNTDYRFSPPQRHKTYIRGQNNLSPLLISNDSANGGEDLMADELHETLKTLSLGRGSPLRMRSVSPSPPNHFSLSPALERRRANTYSAGQLTRPQAAAGVKGVHDWYSPPCSPAIRRINTPRDPVQPSSGSFSDISSDRHSSASGEGDDEDECPGERDQFSSASPRASRGDRSFRPRSRTCPENRAWRKKKLKVLNRPPTPPPSPSAQLGLMTVPLDFHSSPIPTRKTSQEQLPSCAEEEQSS